MGGGAAAAAAAHAMSTHSSHGPCARRHAFALLATTLLWSAATLVAATVREDEERLIGWKGETYNVEALFDPLKHTPNDSIPLPASRSWIEHMSWQPRGGCGAA